MLRRALIAIAAIRGEPEVTGAMNDDVAHIALSHR
jgi:hypothetical protein